MKSDLQKKYLLFLLTKIKGLGNNTIYTLLKKYGSTINIYRALQEDERFGQSKVGKIVKDKQRDKEFIYVVNKEFEKLDENFITIADEDYPLSLKNIYDPPLFLFYRGNIKILQNKKLLTIVGSRQSSIYHQGILKDLINDLQGYSFAIVSGLARGIDSLSHRLALEKNLSAIAVLGSGLSDKNIYPKENLKLAKDIITSDGLLLSEHPNHISAKPYHFPQRNRILAALSPATLVISGNKKSGTLITAQLAIDYGKDVLAVPGNLNIALCQGPNNLIKNGAAMVDCAQDILDFYQINSQTKNKTIAIKNKDHAKIYSLLQNQTMNAVDISRQIQLPLYKTNSLLSQMELEGLIKNNLLNKFEII